MMMMMISRRACFRSSRTSATNAVHTRSLIVLQSSSSSSQSGSTRPHFTLRTTTSIRFLDGASSSSLAQQRLPCYLLSSSVTSGGGCGDGPKRLRKQHRQQHQLYQNYSTSSRTRSTSGSSSTSRSMSSQTRKRPFPSAAASITADDNDDTDNNNNKDDEARLLKEMRQAAMTLLDEKTFPAGELLYDAWMDAPDEILPYWLNIVAASSSSSSSRQYNKRHDDNADNIDNAKDIADIAVESVDIIFKVLTRLAKEQDSFPTLTRCHWINVELLNRIVHHWFVIHQKYGSATKTTTASSTASSSSSCLLKTHYTPRQVMKLVERYAKAFPQSSWSTDIAYYIIVAELRPHEQRNAVFCEEILHHTLQRFQQELEEEEKVAEQAYSRPTARLFQAVISAWTHVAVQNAAPASLISSSSSSLRPTNNAVVVVEAAQKVDALLHLMKQLKIVPTVQDPVFLAAMHAWSRTNSLRGALRVEELLDEMHRFVIVNSSKDNNNDNNDMLLDEYDTATTTSSTRRGGRGDATTTWPWTEAFISAIRAWAWSRDGRAGKQAEKLLLKFQEYYNAGIIVLDNNNDNNDDHDDNDVNDDEHNDHHHNDMAAHNSNSNHNNNVIGVYNAALLCYALLGTPRAARQAQALFWQLKNGHDPTAASKQVSSSSSSAGLDPFFKFKANADAAASGAGDLLKFAQPNAETYYWVTAAMANGGFVAESEAIASDLVAKYTAAMAAASQQHHHSSPPSPPTNVVKPLREMFHAIIIGWSRSNDPNRIQRARAIVRAMENRGLHNEYDNDDNEEQDNSNDDDDDNYLCPTVATYNAYLSCLSKAQHDGAGSIQNAQEAVSVLEKMRFLSNSSLQGGRRGRRRRQGRNDDLRPDCQTYRHVIHCWANCGNAKMAEQYFQEMIADYKNGNEAAKPNTAAVNKVLLAYSRSGDPQTPDRAEAWFRKFFLSSDLEQQQQQLDLQPDLYSFSTFLHCLSKRRKHRQPLSKTAQAVEDVFREMQQRYRTGGGGSHSSSSSANANLLRPNQVMYNVLINCWAQARNPAKAEQIFEEMYQDFTQLNNPNAEPNVRSLNSVMKAWAISGRTDSAERSEKILELMRDLHVNGILTDIRPTCVTYTTLLMSYAMQPATTTTTMPDGTTTITQRADAIVAEMWTLFNSNLLDEAPNEITYRNLLQIWEKSNESNKADRIRAIQEEMRIVFGKKHRVTKHLSSD